MKNNIFIKLALSLLAAAFVVSCEDDAPFDYEEDIYVEAFLFVDEPINNIKVMRTQPLNDAYAFENAIIKDAVVKIIEGADTITLDYDEDKYTNYNKQDYTIKPNTEYKLEIRLQDGRSMTGTTVTPSTFDWARPPKPVIQFPIDSIDKPSPDSLEIEWSAAPGTKFYLLNVLCLDTLEYGKYLEPPQPENMNRRAYNPLFEEDENWYEEPSSYNLLSTTVTPTVWLAFKWFGKHEIIIYAVDYNYIRWFQQAYWTFGEYDPNLNSIEGDGFGCFGSAKRIRASTFVLKNQP